MSSPSSPSLPSLAASSSLQKLTIIAPLYNEGDILAEFHEQLHAVLCDIQEHYPLKCSIIYVDDGSEDNAEELVKSFTTAGLHDLRFIRFSRNFGKEAAMMAGLDHAEEGALVFMDTDGQHPPEMIKDMLNAWMKEGYDVIFTYQDQRQDGFLKSTLIRLIYSLMNSDKRIEIKKNASDFRLLSPRAAHALKQLPERSRFFKGLSVWIGFKQKAIAYTPLNRIGGTTKWSPLALLSFGLTGLISFSFFPLRLLTAIGFFMALGSIFYGIYILIEVITAGVPIPGYPSLIVSNVFLGGILTFMLGLLAEYIGQILNEVKHRPLYIIEQDEHFTSSAKSQDTDIETEDDHPLKN